MIFTGWALLVGISLWVSLIAFFWGMRSGQFTDQERARYLAFTDDVPGRDGASPGVRRRGAGVLLAIAVLALGVFATAVVLSLSGTHGAG